MEEQKIVKKQLLKNMIFTFIAFSLIFAFFDLIIYNAVTGSIYKNVDSELINTQNQFEKYGIINPSKTIENKPIDEQLKIPKRTNNPRFIYIVRDENGVITNQDSIGRSYEEYITQISFDKNNINQVYSTSINNEYFYRGINFKIKNDSNDITYIQILVNVDGETQSVSNIVKTLISTTILMVLISIIASYILAKRTLKPIIESWKRQTEFVQNASHELRTPLTIIQAKQELLLQEPNKKIIDKSQDITVCINETRRLTKLIKELMTLARADSNKLEINKEAVDIDKLIEEVSKPYIEMASLQNKQVELNLEYKKSINLDKNKISELLIIILDNAIKYTSDNDKITIETHSKDGKFLLEISDTGIGIDSEELKHIFERFYRADKARSRETGGNGLGLSIAQTIVQAHGGTIKITKNSPKGTKVIIKI